MAFAFDYQGGGKPLTDRDEMMARIGAFYADPLRTRAIGQAGLEILCAEPRTDTAAAWPPSATASGAPWPSSWPGAGPTSRRRCGFHAGLGTARPKDAANIMGKVLVMIGADDPIVANAQRKAFEEEMTAGGVDWMLNVYGGAVHSFTRPGARGHRHAGDRVPRADGPALLAGDARPVRRGVLASSGRPPGVSDAPSGPGYARFHA